MDTDFWGYAAILAKRVAGKIKLNGQFVGGDVVTTREDLEQEGLMAAASWLNRHEQAVAAGSLETWRTTVYSIIKIAIFSHLKKINRESGRAFCASDWIENIGDDAEIKMPEIERDPDEEAQDTLDEIIESNENDTLKASITCLDREMQAVVLLHNDGFSFTLIAKRMNFSRERPRQLYHKAMSKLKGAVAGGAVERELPLVGAQDTLLFATQEEKLGQLRFRPRSMQGNTDWQALGRAEIVLHQPEGAQVVGDFLNIIRVADRNACLLVEQVGQGGLSPLDLRSQQGLLANSTVEQPIY